MFLCLGGHMGVAKTMNRIQSRYFWPNMTLQVKEYIATCHNCQMENKKAKNHSSANGPVLIKQAKPWYQVT